MTPITLAFRTLAAAAIVAAAPAWAQFTESSGINAQSVADKPRCSTLLETDPRKLARDCTPDALPAPAVDANASASVSANSLDPSGTFPVNPAPQANPGAGAQGSADTQQPLAPPAVPPAAR